MGLPSSSMMIEGSSCNGCFFYLFWHAGEASVRPRQLRSQSRMKDMENPKAFNCLTVVHQLHDSQARYWFRQAGAREVLIKASFLTSKIASFSETEGTS